MANAITGKGTLAEAPTDPFYTDAYVKLVLSKALPGHKKEEYRLAVSPPF
jgi:hypothetical protein